MRFLLLVISLSILWRPAFGEWPDSFKLGIGARPLGMGGAFSSRAEGTESIFWNPAGLGGMRGIEYLWTRDIGPESYIGHAVAIKDFGFGWQQNVEEGKRFQVSSISYGRDELSGRVGFGISCKLIEGDYGEKGYGLDLGFLARPTGWLSIGLVGKDILNPVVSGTRIPTSFVIGTSLFPFGFDGPTSIGLESEVLQDGRISMKAGFELFPIGPMALRAGIGKKSASLGISFHTSQTRVDYAMEVGKGVKHRISVGMSLGKGSTRTPLASIPLPFGGMIGVVDISGPVEGGEGRIGAMGFALGSDIIESQIIRLYEDKRVKGILLRIRDLDATYGAVQEIRREIYEARASGKRVVAYVDGDAIGPAYYLASAAELVVVPPVGAVGGLGTMAVIERYGGLLKKIGIEWETIERGAFKGSTNPMAEGFSSEAQRDEILSLIEDLHERLVKDIAASRSLPEEEVRKIADGRIFTALDAMRIYKLVDLLGYYNDALELLKKACKLPRNAKVVNAMKLEPLPDLNPPFAKRIRVIMLNGEIVSGSGSPYPMMGYVGADDVVAQIDAARKDKATKAIVLRINSPGGSVVSCDQIWNEVMRARREGKVVVASIGDIGASGGYYVASAADKIIANPGAIVGSIGVIFSKPSLQKLYEKLGIRVDVLKKGEYADIFSETRTLSDEEKAMIGALMDEEYRQFLRAVAIGRGSRIKRIEELAEGRIYTAERAKSLGLIDDIGGFSDAIREAMRLGKIKGKPMLLFKEFPKSQELQYLPIIWR
jgi:protease-4